MQKKPSRTFVIWALALMFLLILGIMVVVIQWNCCVPPINLTASYIVTLNMGSQFQMITATPRPELAATQTQRREMNLKITPNPTAYEGCNWQWSQRDLPAITNLAQIALRMVTDGSFTIRVEAYGENCLDSKGNIQYFAAMTTDFYVTAPVESLADEQDLAEQVMNLYTALTSGLEAGWLPAGYGYLDITFTNATGEKHLRTMFSTIEAVSGQRLQGKTLLDALGRVQ